MSDRDDPPRVDAGPLAGLLRSARADGPREDERAALDAAVRAAVAVPARPGTPWRLGAVGVAGVVAAVGWMSTRPAGPPPVAPPPSAALAPPPAAPPSAAPPAARAHVPPPRAAATSAVDAGAAAPRCVTAHHIAAVDAARSALRAHAPARALQLVARDRARCPRGALGEERERIAVEALVARGLRGEAARGLAAFERAYPASLHRRALRALVDGLASPALPSAP